MKKITHAEYSIYSDPKGKLMDLIGVRHKHGRVDGADIARATSVLFDAQGEILWMHVAENYRVRPKPEEVLRAADEAMGNLQN